MTTNLAPHADQVVRHAVDAYIDGRLLPMFEGNFTFETRNSKYCVRDGVLLSAPKSPLLGAEFVGWLNEIAARSEVSSSWKPGARAILVDTRNDGVKGPHIIVTSATRAFRSERAGSPVAQGGSPVDQPKPPRVAPATLPPPPMPVAARAFPIERPTPTPLPPPRPPQVSAKPLSVPPPRVPGKPASLPPPPPPRLLPRVSPPAIHAAPAPVALPLPAPPPFADPSIARRIMATVDAAPSHLHLDDNLPTGRAEKSSPSRLSHGNSMSSRLLPPGRAPARLPPPPATVPFMLSRSFQRGMPLR